MSLKITRATEPIRIDTITMCLYAPPGIGKTSTAFTAEKPLLLDFDRGSYRAGNRGDVVQVEKWEDIASISADDLKNYKTLIVDTAGRALDCLSADIAKGDQKNRRRDGALSQQGFGVLKSTFVSWTKLIRSFGLDVLLLCHSDEQRNGDDLIERLDMTGGSKGEVYKAADAMGRLGIVNGERMLNFSPTDTAFGKNPGQLAPIKVPDFSTAPAFLAGVIADIKGAINKLSEAQVAALAAQTEWKARIDEAAGGEDFADKLNALLEPAKAADEAVQEFAKRFLLKTAIDKGLTFDKAAGKFVGPTAPKEPANQTGAQASLPVGGDDKKAKRGERAA